MRAIVVVLAAASIAWMSAGVARAHGDPASEYLVDHAVFFPIRNPLSQVSQARLLALVEQAKQRGYPIRLALIGSRFDLGTAAEFWGKPRAYAAALDADLAYYYRGPLVVVMPAGLGFSRPGHAQVADLRVLGSIHVASGRDGLAAAAERAVVRLAAAHGVTVSPPAHVTTAAAQNRHDRVVIVTVVAFALLAWWLGRRLLRRRSPVAA
jgi:hypothetical protein